jgi:hypothetical protein
MSAGNRQRGEGQSIPRVWQRSLGKGGPGLGHEGQTGLEPRPGPGEAGETWLMDGKQSLGGMSLLSQCP